MTIDDRLAELARDHGLWVSHQLSITRGRAEIDSAMRRLSSDTPASIAGREVTAVTDYRVGADERPAWLTTHDLVEFELADGRAMIRPSGTEPKCKIYVDLRRELGDDRLDDATADLENDAADVARDLARFVGLE